FVTATEIFAVFSACGLFEHNLTMPNNGLVLAAILTDGVVARLQNLGSPIVILQPKLRSLHIYPSRTAPPNAPAFACRTVARSTILQERRGHGAECENDRLSRKRRGNERVHLRDHVHEVWIPREAPHDSFFQVVVGSL